MSAMVTPIVDSCSRVKEGDGPTPRLIMNVIRSFKVEEGEKGMS